MDEKETNEVVYEVQAPNVSNEGDTIETPRDYPNGRAVEVSESLREINISPLNSGYLVRVGCQSVAVEKTETLVQMLSKYLTNPNEFEKNWYSKNVRNRLENIS